MWQLNTPRPEKPYINKVFKYDPRYDGTAATIHPALVGSLLFVPLADYFGYTQLYKVITDTQDDPNISGDYDLVNFEDGLLYYKIGFQSIDNVVGSPDGIIQPFGTQRIYCPGKPISIVSSIAGYDLTTIRPNSNQNNFTQRSPQTGIYIVSLDNNVSPFNLSVPRQYIRSYDIYDVAWLTNTDVIATPYLRAQGLLIDSLASLAVPVHTNLANADTGISNLLYDGTNAISVNLTLQSNSTNGSNGDGTNFPFDVAISVRSGAGYSDIVKQTFNYQRGKGYNLSTNNVSSMMGVRLSGGATAPDTYFDEIRMDFNYSGV